MIEEKYHFVGLGGIGMSALARVLLQRGAHVQGSDLRHSGLLEDLASEGARIHVGHHAESCTGATIAVYSTDVSPDNVELLRAKELNVPVWHRSEMLHALMTGKKPLLVTGTHGKTTVTALLASVLDAGGLDPSFVVGGIHRQWNTNGRSSEGEYFVAEADESDHSFVKTPAYGAIVTNLENDHLNYWKTAESLDNAFRLFFAQLISSGHLFWCGDDKRLSEIATSGVSYGFGLQNQLRIEKCEPTDSGVRFSISWASDRYSDIDLALFGRHNALNGAAVFGLAIRLGIEESLIREAFLKFAGTCRRLEWKGKARGVDLYDDYGHHPTEISCTLSGLRDKIRERRLVVVFQPHRFSRVHDLFEDFLTCFDEADLVIMTDIYTAGEAPIEGVSSSILYEKMREKIGDKVHFFPRLGLESDVAMLLRPYDVVLTLGAGDITKSGDLILRQVELIGYKWLVGLLFGGTSSEHAVSLMSAKTFIEGVNKELLNVKLFGVTKEGQWVTGPGAMHALENKNIPFQSDLLSPYVMQELTHCDVVIPIFHGQQGEDGMIQGLLDTLNIPYVGCDYRSSALCMQKAWTKHVAKTFGIPTSPYLEFDATTYKKSPELLHKKIAEQLQYPIWVKPVHLGSSVGVYRVSTPDDLKCAVEAVFILDDCLIVEEERVGREVEFSLLGNEYIRLAPPAEIMKEDFFHGYDNKYGSGATPFEIPANLSQSQLELSSSLALEMYQRTGCKGLARIDFFLDSDGQFWLNEINPFPGFTPTSGYPLMWEAGGLTVTALIDELLTLAFHKARRLHSIRGK